MKKIDLWKILAGVGGVVLGAAGVAFGWQKYNEKKMLSGDIEVIDGDAEFHDDPDRVAANAEIVEE